MEETEHCCCGQAAPDAETANRKCLCRLIVAFKWVGHLAAFYFLLMIVAQWVMFFSAPADMPQSGIWWGLLSSLAYAVLGAVLWALFTGFSLALERLLIISPAQQCGEGK